MKQRLSSLDAAFLHFELPHQPMHVAGLYISEEQPEVAGRPGLAGIFRTVEERLSLVPRYRQVVQEVPFSLAQPVWVDDPDFDLAYHLRRLALPRPGGMRELLEVVARIHARPLDRKRPLWEMYIIEGLAGGRVALYGKTHHAMVDGISAVDIATVLMDFDPAGSQPAADVPAFRAAPRPGGPELLVDVARETASTAIGVAASILGRPRAALSTVAARALQASQVRNLLALLKPVPAGPLNVKIGSARRISLVHVSLSRVKAIKNALGGTVNDVVLAAVGEAVHTFLEHRDVDAPPGLVYRVMVPVSVRDESEKMALGNRVSAMFVNLPVGRMPPRQRLEAVTGAMRDLKESRQAVAADQLVAMTSWAPATLHALAGQLEFTNQRLVNLVVSNVPGIQVPVYAGGSRLLEAYPLLPIGANMGVVICVTSYNGGMYFGVVADYDAFDDVDVLGTGISGAFERLERTAGIRKPRQVARRRAAAAAR